MKTSYLEIDQKAIQENIREIQEKIGDKKIMPVIKADGYGTGAEAIHLRRAGWEKEILLLNQLWKEDQEDIQGILRENLTVRSFTN